MPVKIFKLLTSLFLVAVLFVLVSKRDIFVTQKNESYSSTSTLQSDVEGSPPLSLQEAPVTVTSATQTVSSSSPDQTPPLKNIPTDSLQKKTPLTQSVYEQLNEGISDTDESYRPIISPCHTKMGYKLGTFDTRFGISKAMFLQEIKAASDTWGDALGKQLFYYDEQGSLTINLIYDSRQAQTEDLNFLALEIENSKDAAAKIKQQFEQEKEKYTEDGQMLTKDTDSFQLRYKAYTDKVEAYNAGGGAPREEYDMMMKELASMKEEAATLDARRVSLIATMDSINKKVTKYNELVKYSNSLIRRSNAVGAVRFTEGRFSSGNNTIDIFQYSDSVKLRRVLTHELGHAIGINHTKNVQSIMYSVNSATTTMLSKEDLLGLQAACAGQ